MFASHFSENIDRLVIEASKQGVLKFATVRSNPRPQLGPIHQVDIRSLPTFTDALQQFETTSGLGLRRMHCAIAVAGPTKGETFSPARSRWTITRTGLAAMFGQPIRIVNDVAARAWAIQAGTAQLTGLRGFGSPNLAHPGRYVMLMVEEGVGSSIIDVDDDGRVNILEAEGGHMEFAASSQLEERLARSARGPANFISWEKMLMLDDRDPVWSDAGAELTQRGRADLLATMLARLSVNLIYSYAAWDGVFITGGRGIRILQAGSPSALDRAFAAPRMYSRLANKCPVWTVEQKEAVLTGAAECLWQNAGLPVAQAA